MNSTSSSSNPPFLRRRTRRRTRPASSSSLVGRCATSCLSTILKTLQKHPTATIGILMLALQSFWMSKIYQLQYLDHIKWTAEEGEGPNCPLSHLKLNTKTLMLDIGIPISGKEVEMNTFAITIAKAVQDLRTLHGASEIEVRLLLSAYAQDDTSLAHKLSLQSKSGVNDVIFVPVTGRQTFSRAASMDAIRQRACYHHHHAIEQRETRCALALVDVDMHVGVEFFVNVLNHVTSGNVYFPIVFSTYRPSTILLIEGLRGPQPKFGTKTGLWRKRGFGMLAMHYQDLEKIPMDTDFSGWGGEDVSYYRRVIMGYQNQTSLNAIRWNEVGLVHFWHPKYCIVGRDVSKEKRHACQESRAGLEGEKVGRHLQELVKNNRRELQDLWDASPNTRDKNLTQILELADQEYDKGLLALEDQEV